METIKDITPNITLWAGIQLAEVLFGIILLIFLLKVSTKLKWYLPLATYVILVILDYSSAFLMESGYIKHFPHLLYANEPFNLLLGLCIYIYARSQEYQRLKFSKIDLLFFVPFLLSLITYIPYYLFDAQGKLNDFIEYGDLSTSIDFYLWEWIFQSFVNVSFLGAALKRFSNYNEKIMELYSDIRKTGFLLTQLLIKFCMGIYIIELIFVYLSYYGFEYYLRFFHLCDLIQLITLVLIGYDALTSYKHSSAIKEGWQRIQLQEGQSITEPIKYAKSNLTHNLALELKAKLEKHMIEHEPYLQSQLRIKDLAEQTHIPSHQISQLINEQFQKNFYEFINLYRVNKAKAILKDPQYSTLTFSAIGFEAGFNSKTAFYNAFKKETGTTPAQFKASLTT